jgi:hypothetical protein
MKTKCLGRLVAGIDLMREKFFRAMTRNAQASVMALNFAVEIGAPFLALPLEITREVDAYATSPVRHLMCAAIAK